MTTFVEERVAPDAGRPLDSGASDEEWAGIERRRAELRTRSVAVDLAGYVAALESEFSDADVADELVVDALLAWERVVSSIRARQDRLLARHSDDARAARRAAEASGCTRRLKTEELERFARMEISAAMGWSDHYTRRRVSRALDIITDLPSTHFLQLAGSVTTAQAQAIAEESAMLHPVERSDLEEWVLADAEGSTTGQTRRKARRYVAQRFPDMQNTAHLRAREKRGVWKRPLVDGMSLIEARVPAGDGEIVFDALTRLAEAAGSADGRTLDQRRADVLTDLALAGLGGGCSGGGRALTTTLNVTVPATLLAAAIEQLRSGGAGQDNPERSHFYHPSSSDPHLSARDPSAPPGFVSSDGAAVLDGYGYIPPALAARLAADAVWRRILTDPASGRVLEVGRGTYRPPAELADLVVARDQRCVFPGCAVPAARCDLDHTIPYPRGETSAGNLGALSRGHHRLKTFGDWRLRQLEPGRFEWTDPHRRTYRVGSRGLDSEPVTERYHDEPPPF